MQIKHIFFKYCLRYFIGFLIVLLACVPIIVVSHSIIERKVLESNWLRLEEGVVMVFFVPSNSYQRKYPSRSTWNTTGMSMSTHS